MQNSSLLSVLKCKVQYFLHSFLKKTAHCSVDIIIQQAAKNQDRKRFQGFSFTSISPSPSELNTPLMERSVNEGKGWTPP